MREFCGQRIRSHEGGSQKNVSEEISFEKNGKTEKILE